MKVALAAIILVLAQCALYWAADCPKGVVSVKNKRKLRFYRIAISTNNTVSDTVTLTFVNSQASQKGQTQIGSPHLSAVSRTGQVYVYKLNFFGKAKVLLKKGIPKKKQTILVVMRFNHRRPPFPALKEVKFGSVIDCTVVKRRPPCRQLTKPCEKYKKAKDSQGGGQETGVLVLPVNAFLRKWTIEVGFESEVTTFLLNQKATPVSQDCNRVFTFTRPAQYRPLYSRRKKSVIFPYSMTFDPNAAATPKISYIFHGNVHCNTTCGVKPVCPTTAPPPVETTTPAPPPVETTTAPPPVEETTTAPPPVEETTTEAPPPVEETTTEAPPPVEETTTEAPPPVEETTTEAPPPVEETTTEAPPPVEETTTEAPPPVEETTTEAPPPVEETTTEAPPEVTTEAPEVTTEAPEVTTGAPEVTTELPEVTTEAPEVTTAAPEVTTVAPEVTTEAPEVTTAAPEVTTGAPEATTEAPEVTTEAPEVTTAAPEVTTEEPEVTTGAPEVTTEAPEVTSEAPEATTQPPSNAFDEDDYDIFDDFDESFY